MINKTKGSVGCSQLTRVDREQKDDLKEKKLGYIGRRRSSNPTNFQ